MTSDEKALKEFKSSQINVSISLEEYINSKIDDSAKRAADYAVSNLIEKHELSCTARKMEEQIKKDHDKLDKLNMRFYLFLASLAGAGGWLGGFIGSLIKG